MLRVLTLATLFPNAAEPTLGGFVERQTRGLAAMDGVDLRLVSPIGRPPWPLSRHPRYRRHDGVPAAESWSGVPVLRPRVPVLPGPGHVATARAMARRLLPMLRALRHDFPFDVIDAQFFWPDGVVAQRLAAALGVPFSVKARGSDIHYWGARAGIAGQIAAAGRAADGLLAVSAAMKDDMVALGMPTGRIRVHHTGVDQDRFVPVDRAAARAALGLDAPLIVTVGTLIGRKGQHLVLAALDRLPHVHAIFVGDGPDRARFDSAARRFGDRVRFLGTRPHAELPALLAAADVMVLPSASEGLANVWVEALACGTPIVVTDVGGAREVVDRPAAGRIVARDPAAIADAVRAILADPPAQAAVRAAAARFTWEANARSLRSHLQSIVASRLSRAA